MGERPAPRILVVDDEPRLLEALCDTLRSSGFDTVGATSPKEALEALSAGRFALLLTDLTMPDMDGISLLRLALVSDPDLAVVIMTGQGTIDTAVEAMKAGALDYILKPFKISVALPVLSRSLEVRRLRLENAEFQLRERRYIVELEERNEELASFSAAAAHDLRSPLVGIDGFAWILANEYAGVLDDHGLEMVGRIRNGTKKMGALIDGLLTLARVTSAKPTRTDVDMSSLSREIANEIQGGRPARNLSFEIEPEVRAYADEQLVSVALRNLLGNAAKFTANVEVPQVSFGCDRSDPRQPFFVRDNGAGFDPNLAQNLFKPFQRLHSEREFAGSGIGLSTVQRVVERHGGELWAESQPGRGASFFFTLGAESEMGPRAPFPHHNARVPEPDPTL